MKNSSISDRHKIVFLFSGQGSHYRGMGERLYNTNPTFAASLESSDKLVREHLGRSVIEELYVNKENKFDDLLITHPSIVAIELAMYDLISELGIRPDYVSGNSLGEFAAAVVAGAWTKEMALESAIEQAKSIVQHGERGGMLAVIDIARSQLDRLLSEYDLFIASENFPNHYTLSGEEKKLDAIQLKLEELALPFLRLPVLYPFHCPLIENGKSGFIYYTYTTPPFAKPMKGFVSGLYGKEKNELPKEYFWRIAKQPTVFSHTIDYMERAGPCLYMDLGPSGTSATFAKYNISAHSESTTLPIMTPFKREDVQLKRLHNLLQLS